MASYAPLIQLPSIELLTAFAAAPSGKRATGVTYAELLDALKADPDEAAVRLRALLKHPRAAVRSWACIVGAKACGRSFVPELLAAFNDGNQDVEEMALSGLQEIDPEGQLLRPLMLQMRPLLRKWDGEGGFRIARLLVIMDDTDAVPYLRAYLERKDIDASERVRVEVYVSYLTEGLEPVLERIRNHADHVWMFELCNFAFYVGRSDVEPALDRLRETAPDERCRMIAQQALDALTAARAEGPPPYWSRRIHYKNLPRR